MNKGTLISSYKVRENFPKLDAYMFSNTNTFKKGVTVNNGPKISRRKARSYRQKGDICKINVLHFTFNKNS